MALMGVVVVSKVNTALESQDRDEILALADELDGYNNLGCPLDAFGGTE